MPVDTPDPRMTNSVGSCWAWSDDVMVSVRKALFGEQVGGWLANNGAAVGGRKPGCKRWCNIYVLMGVVLEMLVRGTQCRGVPSAGTCNLNNRPLSASLAASNQLGRGASTSAMRPAYSTMDSVHRVVGNNLIARHRCQHHHLNGQRTGQVGVVNSVVYGILKVSQQYLHLYTVLS